MTTSVTTPTRKPRLTDLTPILRTATGTPTARTCSVLTAAARQGINPALVRRWILNGPDRDLAGIARSPLVWARLATSATTLVAGSSSSEGRAVIRGQVATRLFGRLLQPVALTGGLTGKRLVTARFALAVIGVEHLRGATAGGFQGGFVNESDLAVRMGVSRPTARAAVRTLETLGWLTATKRAPGSAARMKVAPLPRSVEVAAFAHLGVIEMLTDPDLADRLDDVEVDPETVAVLAGLPDDGRAMDLVRSVEHPVWSYSRTVGDRAGLTHRHWIVALADQAGVDPVTLGVPDRVARSARRDLDRSGVGPTHTGSLAEQLDRVAVQTGAAGRHGDAWEKRTEQKVVRREARATVMAEREATRAAAKAARAKRTRTTRGGASEPVRSETLTVTVPVGFDPTVHGARLLVQVEAAGRGAGWTIGGVDPDTGTVMLVRSRAALAG